MFFCSSVLKDNYVLLSKKLQRNDKGDESGRFGPRNADMA